MNLSYWEKDAWFDRPDFVVIGSGIVGLSTAYHLKKKTPSAKILILEKGILPEGASTKNAGFACFGTLSEILGYLKNQTKEEVFNLVKDRYQGLQKLRNILGDENMDYRPFGGYELFREEDRDLMENSLSQLDEVNSWLFPIFEDDAFKAVNKDFRFNHIIGMVESPFEGQIHAGKMIRSFIRLVNSMDIPILNGVEVTSITDTSSGTELEVNHNFKLKAGKAFLCTNAFANNLLDVDITPGRGQVLVTSPIENLKVKGNFHIYEGFYYFRSIGNRVMFGGARNLDIPGETTKEFGITDLIQNQLETYLREIILPGQPFEIEQRWSGIMGFGGHKEPIVQQISDNIYCGVRLSGIGVAIGASVGEELADLV